MTRIFDLVYIAFLDRRIKSLEADLAKDKAYQAKLRIDGLIAEVVLRMNENKAALGVEANRNIWAERNASLSAEKAALERRRVPLPDKQRELLAKLRLYKLRKHVFTMYIRRRKPIQTVVIQLPETQAADGE